MIYQAFTKSKLSLVIVASLALVACGGTGTKAPQPENPPLNQVGTQASSGKVQIVAEAGLSPRERYSKAIENIGKGESEVALVELEAYLKEVPRSSRNTRRAVNLINQIKTDSLDYFPAEFFTIKLQSGQTLGTLAKRYLGSALEFYALAKYNNVANPNSVNIGSTIKIPLTQLARSIKAKEDMAIDEAPTIEEVVEVEVETEATLNIEELIDESDIIEDIPEVVEAPVVTAQSLSQSLIEANSSADYASSVSIIESLKSFGDLSSESAEQALMAFEGHADNIKADDPITASNLYLEAGQLYLNKDDQMAAFEQFKMASDTDSANTQASNQMLSLQKEITEKYYREATTAYSQQDLPKAIAKYDIVLAVDPDHLNASVNRTKAVELKQKLEAFK